MARGSYDTRQRQSILAVMADHEDTFLSVDMVGQLLRAHGMEVGRTTVYRTLERMVSEGDMLKVADIRGGAAQYRLAPAVDPEDVEGQLRCDRCGRVLPLSCSSLGAFAEHVLVEHGFAIDPAHTVLHGVCPDCRESSAHAAAPTETSKKERHK
ncbi:MAG: transcriptional repressor [Coriobacteriaceae bacterium]|nr:transcriptional repressor [Coriobacteriaceae bacterium]